MHRLSLVALVGLLLAGCAHAPTEVRDPPYVEQLRVRITKVRHAISETRRTIAASQGAPYLPELHVRLAELLSEEAKYHYQVAYEREQRSSKALHVPQVRLLKEQAISTYRFVLRRWPDTPLAARALFNIAHEQRELGEYEEMLKTLEELVTRHASSPLRNEGLLVLGDYHFDRNDLGAAERWYAEILRGGPSRVSGLAFYKLAWVRVNHGDCKRALGDFENAIVASKGWLQHQAAQATAADVAEDVSASGQDIDVRREALIDLTYCYSRERKPEDAVGYLAGLASTRGAYVAALSRLATRYGIMDHSVGAVSVGRELLRLAPDDPDRLDDARMLFTGVKRLGRYDDLADDLRLITRAALRQAHRPGTSEEASRRLLAEFEAYVRDLVTRGQTYATRRSKRLLPEVARAYVAYLDAFPTSEHRGEMVLNLADVLAASGDDLGAGRRYLEAAQGLEKGDERRDALYDAVVHLQKALEAPALRQVDRVVARAGLRRGGTELLAYDLDADKSRRVKFAVARTLYDEGDHREAIDRLTAVAYEYPRTDEARASIHLVLDSFRTINDFQGLMAAGHRFLAKDGPVDARLRSEIQPIVQAAEQRQLDELSLQAAGDEGGGIAELEEFAARYAGSSLGERALLNAFVAARAAGDSARLYRLGDEIAEKYPKSEQLPGILSTLARTAAARFELDRSIELFRRAAEVNPAERVALLVASGQLQEELADLDGARRAYEEALKVAEGPARAAPAARLAELLERLGDSKVTASRLRPFAADGNPEVLARLGLAQLRRGSPDEAESTLQGVLESGAAASADAQARAHYGMAEVLNAALEGFDPGTDVMAIQEFIALVEVTEQSYLNAARQGSPLMTAAALSRLARMAETSAGRFEAMQAPSGLSPAETDQVKQAFVSRAAQLRAEAGEVLAACAGQAWNGNVFNPAVRSCLAGRIPDGDPVAFDALDRRKAFDGGEALEELRGRLSRNPEDVEGLRELGERFLDGGDAHAARLVFARAIQSGGGPGEQNLLGVASWLAGDFGGALEAFSQAAEAGLEASRRNLVYGLGHLGLGDAAKEALRRIAPGAGEGRLLPGAEAVSMEAPVEAAPAKAAQGGES